MNNFNNNQSQNNSISMSKYSVYLVPFDYNGPIQSNFVDWGGIKPHVTLFSFKHLDYTKLHNLTKSLASAEGSNQWLFNTNDRNSEYYVNSTFTMLLFSSRRIENIMSEYKKHFDVKIRSKQLHITFGYTNNLTQKDINEIYSNIIDSKDWRLVIVESKQIGEDDYEAIWRDNFKLYY